METTKDKKDPDAPIFQVADFGVVGDLFREIRKATREEIATECERYLTTKSFTE